MSNTDIVGRTGAPFRMVVEEGKVREFAAAVGASRSDQHGRDGVAPATFLMSDRFWQDDASSPWTGLTRDFRRLLHGEQSFVFHGPPPEVGAELVCQQRIDNVYSKQGKRGGSMNFTEVVTEYRDSLGALVAESRTTTIETSQSTQEAG
jgi:hypothetical protein